MDDKRTYKTHKEYGEDMSYENEAQHKWNSRGDSDLTKQIEELQSKLEDKDIKVVNLTNLEEIHRKTNGDLRVELQKKDKEIYDLKKEMAMVRETAQIDLLTKDKEIGRLMKKINESGEYGKK
tara:strand:- start:113 stop:481 length:369 start_codon:yes stop_codon:yes gene_type:complete